MPATPRIFRLTVAVLASGLIGRAVAQSGSKESPFLPPATATAAAAAPNEQLEFAGVNVMGTKTLVTVFDKQGKKGRWIPVGGIEGGISVIAYDQRREQIVVKSGDVQKTLTLRKGVGTLNAPTPGAGLPAAAGFGAPLPPGFEKIQPPPPTNLPASGSDNSAPAAIYPAVEPAPKSDGPAKPLSVARQEEEARMLVSDLLEIGMAQRKAYEEAQRKAGGTTEQPATPAPANPP